MTPATSLGFSAIDFTEGVLGIALLPWQRWLLIHCMELRPGGRFRFRTVLILVARQNGKTTLVEVKNLWKMFVLGVPLIVGTAQDLDIAEESWDKALEIIEDVEDLNAELGEVCKVNGKKSFKLSNGSRWKIKASSRRAGRGLSGDDVNLDELREHQTWAAWSAISKTTMARANAQVFGFSNAGDDRSVVLNGLRKKALMSGVPGGAAELETIPGGLTADEAERFEAIASDSLGIFEWSAPPDCDIADRSAWAQANPSLGYTIEESTLADAVGTDDEAVFRTECLCQHVPDMAPKWRSVAADRWAVTRDSKFDGPLPTLVLEVAAHRVSATVAGAGDREDGRIQVAIVEHRAGTDWVVPWAKAIWAEPDPPRALIVDPKSEAGVLIPDLEDAGVPVDKIEPPDLIAAYVRLTDGLKDEHDTVRHSGDAPMTAAAEKAVGRKVGDRTTWDRSVPGGAPIIAASIAMERHLAPPASPWASPDAVPVIWK